MDWLAKILTSDNAVILVILLIVLIVLISILAKKGIVAVNSKGVTVGGQEKERTIIRQQIEFAETACVSFFDGYLPESSDEYRMRYIHEKLYDEIVKWISFNHITTDPTYVEIKQDIMWNIIQKYTKNITIPEGLQEKVNSKVKHIITKLVEIRKYYQR